MSFPAAYTHKIPSGDPEIVIALRWLRQQQSDSGGRLLVFAPGKANIAYSPLLADTKGLLVATPRTFRRSVQWNGGPVLALWPDVEMLSRLDNHRSVTAVAAVPWQLEDLRPWILSRQPIDLLGVAEQVDAPVIADPVVRVAMEHLTILVNLSSGLTHPSDKAHAVNTFKALRTAGYTWDPDIIHAWALTHGWHNRGADDLKKYATGIQAGRAFQTKRSTLRSDVVKIWETEAHVT